MKPPQVDLGTQTYSPEALVVFPGSRDVAVFVSQEVAHKEGEEVGINKEYSPALGPPHISDSRRRMHTRSDDSARH